MKVTQLTLEETQDLIESYQSQLKRVEFQTAQLQKTISALEIHLGRKQKQKEREDARLAKAAARAAKNAGKTAGKRGRPKKETSSTANVATKRITKKASSTRKKKVDGRKNRKIVGGYRLGEWDSFLLNTLKEQNRALINSEILEFAQAYNKKKGRNKLTDELLRRKLAAAMHKLANKRGAIVKTPYSGKGFAYALPKWTRGGKLRKDFAR